MTMLEIYKSVLPEYARVENVKKRPGKYTFDLVLEPEGIRKQESIPVSWNPDKAEGFCQAIIRTTVAVMYLDAGYIDKSREALDTLPEPKVDDEF